jgi:hypothetical protein
VQPCAYVMSTGFFKCSLSIFGGRSHCTYRCYSGFTSYDVEIQLVFCAACCKHTLCRRDRVIEVVPFSAQGLASVCQLLMSYTEAGTKHKQIVAASGRIFARILIAFAAVIRQRSARSNVSDRSLNMVVELHSSA